MTDAEAASAVREMLDDIERDLRGSWVAPSLRAMLIRRRDALTAVLDTIDAGEPPTPPMTLECQHMDPASGLTQPCFTASIQTAHHWCEPCLRYARVTLSRLLPMESVPQRDVVLAFAATLPMMREWLRSGEPPKGET